MATIAFLIAAAFGLTAMLGMSRMLVRRRRVPGFEQTDRVALLGKTAGDDAEDMGASLSTIVALSALAQAEDCRPGDLGSCEPRPSSVGEMSSSIPASSDVERSSAYEGAGSTGQESASSSPSSSDPGTSSYDGGNSSSYDGGSSSSYDSSGSSSY